MEHETIVSKPWGEFRQYTQNKPSTVKILSVKAGEVLSKQYHEKREELWVALDSGLIVEIDEIPCETQVHQTFFIKKKSVHRLHGGKNGGRVLEIAFGEFDEDDIVRLEDNYGRVP